jgi:predicted  nucleic acid-binding Zn-ribbon protein
MQRKIDALEHELTILKERVKEVEMELLAAQK